MNTISKIENLEIAVTTVSATATVQPPGLNKITAQALFLIGEPTLITSVFTATFINNENSENSAEGVLNLKSSYTNTTIIPYGVKFGNSFVLNQLTLNTSRLSIPIIIFDFAGNIISNNLDRTINFQVFKNRYDQLEPVGPMVVFSKPAAIDDTFKFFVSDKDSFSNDLSTYKLVATLL